MDEATIDEGFASHQYLVFGVRGEDIPVLAFVDSVDDADTLSLQWTRKGIVDSTEIWERPTVN